jgi:hypothetical protein
MGAVVVDVTFFRFGAPVPFVRPAFFVVRRLAWSWHSLQLASCLAREKIHVCHSWPASSHFHQIFVWQ